MQKGHPFEQNVVAFIWDFDRTLIPGHMQEPLFKKYGVDPIKFWGEVSRLEEYYEKRYVRVNGDTIYLNHFLTYVREGIFEGLNNDVLEEMGKELEFYPGMPEFFGEVSKRIESDERFEKFGIKVEHYVVSTGFTAMIKGSLVAKYVKGIWGCEFIEHPARAGFGMDDEEPEERVISQVAYALDNTSKTRALFEINKGVNVHEGIDVNSNMKEENRRVPFQNMIYIADGPTDVPAFSIVNSSGGKTFAVYPAKDIDAFKQIDSLRGDGRVHMYGEADYRDGSHTYMWLYQHGREIAEGIARKKEAAIRASASRPPKHIG